MTKKFMDAKCYKCNRSFEDNSITKYGLHIACYKAWFDPKYENSALSSKESVEEFVDIIPREVTSYNRTMERTVNDSFFQGKFKKYSAKVYDTEYILKVHTKEYEELPKTEYLCNQIAKSLGLDVAKYYLIKYPEKSDCFVTYNFMQDFTASNLIHIYHFIKEDEEFNVENIFNVIKDKTGKYSELVKFIKMCLFDALIGNHDRHGRNIGLIQSSSNYILSPCYDNPSYLGIEDDLLGADLNPIGKIHTSQSKEPTVSDYANDFINLGYKEPIEEFFDGINLKKIKGLIESSFISKKRKEAFIRLITKRYMEFENVIDI